MKIKKEELKEALSIVKPGLANKELIEQSTSFAFVNGTVVTYNDEISISHPVKGLELQGAVKAEELYNLLSKLKEEEIDLVLEGNEILITCGKAKAGIRLEEEIKLPLEEIGSIDNWKDVTEDFVDAIAFVLPACGRDMSKAVLTCVHIRKAGGAEASDGYKLARYKSKGKLDIDDNFLIPANSARILINKDIKKISKTDGWCHFLTSENTVISCRILNDKFPDISEHIKVEGQELTLPQSLTEVIERTKVFAKRDYEMDESILIKIADNRMKIKGESQTGWYREEINMKYKDEPITFAITPSLLTNILSKTNTCIVGENKILFKKDNWEYMSLLRNMDKKA